MRKCPQCGDSRSRYSHRNGVEKAIGVLLQLRPYRCRACMRRYWGLAFNPRSLHRHRHLLVAAGVVLVALVGSVVFLKTLPYESELPRAPGVRPAPLPVEPLTTPEVDPPSQAQPSQTPPPSGQVAGPDLETASAADEPSAEDLGPRLPEAPPFEAADLKDRGRLLDVITASDASELHLLLQTDAPPRTFQHFRLLNPERLVIDIQGRWQTDLPGALPLGHDLARQLRIGSHEDMVRIVVELKDGNIVPPEVQVRADGLALVLKRP